MIFIGDSFSDQLVYALTKSLPDMSWSPNWLIRYDGFAERQTFGMGGKKTHQPLQHDTVLSEILTKDLLIIEVSDGNVYRDAANLKGMEFGATQVLLDGLLTKANAGIIDSKSFLLEGWRADGDKQWRTTGHLASFAIRPPTDRNPIQITADLENLASDQSKPRRLDILLDGKPMGQATMAQGRGKIDFTLPSTTQWQDALVAEITLRDTSGESLAMLLHGVQILGAGIEKTTNGVVTPEVTPLPELSDQTDIRTINLISSEQPEDILVEGLSSLESNGKESWRWALGPATRIKFYVDSKLPDHLQQRLLKFSFRNGPIPDQIVTIRLNGEDIRRFSSEQIAASTQIDTDISLATRPGVNILEIVYQDWNHGKKVSGSDPRQLAVAVMRLSLQGSIK